MAYVRNLPKRFKVKFDTWKAVSGGAALQIGSTTTSRTATAPRPSHSRFGIASPGGEETGGPALKEQDHRDQDRDLGEDRPEGGLDDLVQLADPHRGEQGPHQLADAAGHHDHE